MRNKFVISIFFLILTFSASAQTLDPTVEVSREYEGKLIEVHKPSINMAVPDSVTRFALDFDYSVFANPYKGSYDFNPYLLSMKPSVSDNGENRFYLRAGAGYQLRPTLDLVWSPGFKRNGFNLDVYALHRSFVGNYLTIDPVNADGSKWVCDKISRNDTWCGYDLLSKAGVAARMDREKVAMNMDAGYFGLHQKDIEWERGFDALDATMSIVTKPEVFDNFVFDATVDYRLGRDKVSSSELTENIFGVELKMGPFRKDKHRVSFDVGADIATYAGAFDVLAGNIYLAPRYVYRKDRFNASLGLRFSKLLKSDDDAGMFSSPEQYVYPDVKISYVLFPQSMKLYFEAGGGNYVDTYSSLIAENHHLTHLMQPIHLDYNVERVALIAGFDGRITDKFSYNFRAGYTNYANMMHYAFDMSQAPRLYIEYVACQKWFAALDWALDVEGFRFDGTVSYDRYWGGSSVYDGSGSDQKVVLRPAALTGQVALEYNWKKRLLCGLDCDFSTSRKGGVVVPGYADLGFCTEYATARNLSFWLRAGNLLNMTIQRSPLYAEKGVNVTLGICVNL